MEHYFDDLIGNKVIKRIYDINGLNQVRFERKNPLGCQRKLNRTEKILRGKKISITANFAVSGCPPFRAQGS